MLRRRIGAWPLAIGGLGWLAVLGLVLAAAAPGGSYLTAIPALFGAAGAIGALLVKPWWARLAALVAGAAVAVVILAPTVLLFFPALGLATGGAAAAFAALLGLALVPVLEWTFPPPDDVLFPAESAGMPDTCFSAESDGMWTTCFPAESAGMPPVVDGWWPRPPGWWPACWRWSAWAPGCSWTGSTPPIRYRLN